MGGRSSKALLSRDDDARAFLHLAPSERDAFRFATIGLNLPEDESFFTPWDLLAEVKSFMEQLNYVVLVGTTWRGPSVKWVPLLSEDIAKEFRAIRFLNAGSHAHLVLRGVISIGDEFLTSDRFLIECSFLKTIDLSGLTAVTSIGDGFLGNCSSLVAIDLSGFTAVTSIGSFFLGNSYTEGSKYGKCSSLKTIDLSGFTNVTSIGDSFLLGGSSLTTIDLSGLTAVTSIGRFFLSKCSSLTTIDLSGLTAVTSIGDFFLERCSSLTTVNLSGFRAVTSIGPYFLCECSSLTTINLSGLTNVTSIGDSFLRKCSSLIAVNMSSAMAALPHTSHLLNVMRPSVPPDPASTPRDTEELRPRLVRFFAKYNPEKLSSVESILGQYVGKEEKLFDALIKKYGPEPLS